MFKKVLALVFSVLSFSLVFASSAKALTVGSIAPEYSPGSKIEFNTPTDENTFDVTFLAKNQNLTYRTTITNDNTNKIEITNIELTTPGYDFLEYSFNGLSVGDILNAGASQEITINLSSNSNDTRTIEENFRLSIHYHILETTPDPINPEPTEPEPINPEPTEPEPELPVPNTDTKTPDTGANTGISNGAKNNYAVIYSLSIIAFSGIALSILIKSKRTKNSYAVIGVLSFAATFLTLTGVVTAEKDEVLSITGKVRFINVYSITINPGAGKYQGQTGIKTVECRDGEELIIDDPTYETYNFTGWATEPQTTFTTDDEGHRILIADNNYELSAQWDEIYYNLTIDPNGGTYNGQVGIQVLPIRVGTTANLATPEKTGANFVNWTKVIGDNSETITDMNINVEEDVTLIANYEDIYFDITINPNGGTYNGSTATTTEHVKYGTELTISDPSYNTYTFAGWDINPTTTMNNKTITAYDNYTLTAQWDEIYYNLTINPNGGSYNNNTETQVLPYRAGTTIQLATPEKTGANFTNWTKTIGETSEAFTGTNININTDITLLANYEDIYFDITINPNGGTYNGSTTTTTEHVKYGTELTISDPTYETYRFAGWNIVPSTTMENNTLIAYDNYTLTAQWEEIYYILTINPNGGIYKESTETQELYYRANTVVDGITTPTKEGMRFTNWTKTINETSEAFTGTSLTMNSNITLLANYEDLYFNVTVDPNGGKFDNSTSVYSASFKYGSTLDLRSIEKDDSDLTNWTKNGNDSLPATTETVQIFEDLTLVANWQAISYHTVTINPNGGLYEGSASQTVMPNLRHNRPFTLGESSNGEYVLDYYEVVSGTVDTASEGRLTANSFTVVDDVVLTAHWARIVARIERTGKLYGSIMAAHNEAIADDIIMLLVDTEEVVTNEKTVTLDLNQHTVTGSLTNTNNGNITIINGEINNPSGAAVTNNGTLTIGIDDYNNDGTANILNDNVRLIGTTAGIMQTNNTYKFYYYDGYLEGDLGLVGGYDGSPSYRNTFDDVVVHYYPFVSHVEQGSRKYQHVELESSDRAVSKTSVHGDIYYYNLQDNINTSIETGYKIYAVRNFDAGYTITSPANTNVTIDIVGYTVNLNDTMTLNGTLNFEDSSSTVTSIQDVNDEEYTFPNLTVSSSTRRAVTPHDNSTTTANYGGKLYVSRTITNNTSGKLSLKNIFLTGPNSNRILTNNGTLEMEASVIQSNGVVMNGDSGQYNLDNNSYIATTGDVCAVDNRNSFVWDTDGIIYGEYYALCNYSNPGSASTSSTSTANVNIKKGLVYGKLAAIYNNGWKTTTTISGGTVKSKRMGVAGVGIFRMYSGKIIVTQSERYEAVGVIAGNIIMNGGKISVIAARNSTSSSAIGLQFYNDIYVATRQLYVNGGEIIAQNLAGNASYGITTGNGGSFDKMGTLVINGGTITSISNGGTGYGVYIYHDVDSYIYGGTIYGRTYGFHSYSKQNEVDDNGGTRISNPKPAVIGDNDGTIKTNVPVITGGRYAIYNGQFEFYDGILHSVYDTIADNVTIRAIPEGAIMHTESNDEYNENTWLIEDTENYLSVNGVEYNALTAAYNAAQSGDTITVIADKTVTAALPENQSGKTITIDLNGHELTYYQTLSNKGTMTITDSSTNQTGKLSGILTDTPTITNTGILNIEAGRIDSNYMTINNISGGTVNLSGGTIHGTSIGIYNVSPRNVKSTLNITGGQIVVEQANTNVAVYGIQGGSYSETNINVSGTEPVIAVTANGKTAYGLSGNQTTLTSGNIQVSNTNGSAYGLYLYDAVGTINGGNITVTASDMSYGINTGGSVDRPLVITAINVNSTSTNGTGYGIFSSYSPQKLGPQIIGGTVKGSSYGIFAQPSYSSSGTVNMFEIGENDGQIQTDGIEIIGGEAALAKGPIAFYDGIIRGGTMVAQENAIGAMPEGTTLHTEASSEYAENGWLVKSTNYLQVGSTQFNSLDDAYNATTSENNVVMAIADATAEAILPENPTDKNIIFDLNGHEITFSQPLITKGNYTIRDSSAEKTGKLINNSSSASAVLNQGNLTIESGYIQSTNSTTIMVDVGSITTVNGGTVYSSKATAIGVYQSYVSGTKPVVNINGGLISADATNDSPTAIKAGYLKEMNVNITGGQIRAENKSTNNYTAYAIYGVVNLTIEAPNDETVLYAKNNQGGAYGASQCDTINFKSGKVITEGRETYGISGGTVVVDSGTFYSHADTSLSDYTSAQGLSGTYVTINNATIDVRGNSATGIRAGNSISFKNGTVNAQSISSTSMGLYISGSGCNSSNPCSVTGGTIIATKENTDDSVLSQGLYIYQKDRSISISNAEIRGGTHGIYNAEGTAIILGSNDGTLSNQKPLIVGGNYAIANGVTQFYDGTLKGGASALTNTNLSIATNSSLKISSEHDDVNNKDYEVYQLQTSHDVVQIGNTKYTSLASAISNAVANDVIEYIDDNYITSQVTIPSGKTITIDTKGYKTFILNKIVNKGNTTITDNSPDKSSSFNSNVTGYFITNNAGATLTVSDMSIAIPQIIENKGTLVLSGATLDATDSAISNTGNIQATNSHIINNEIGTTTNSNGTTTTSARYAIDSNGGNSTFNNVTIDGLINNASGTMTFNNSTISKTEVQTAKYLVTNAGTIELNATQVSLDVFGEQGSPAAIYNTGTIRALNQTAISTTNDSATGNSYLYGIHSKSGTITITDSTITSDNTGRRSSGNYGIYNESSTININSGLVHSNNPNGSSIGIYNATGNINIVSGTIRADGNLSNTGVIGIRNDSGTITIGTPEPTTSPNYGGENADVSTTDPSIIAISAGPINNDYGIYNGSGQVYFYDGMIVGKRAAMNKEPTGVEYLYEPKDEVYENNHHVRTLEWMRTQP